MSLTQSQLLALARSRAGRLPDGSGLKLVAPTTAELVTPSTTRAESTALPAPVRSSSISTQILLFAGTEEDRAYLPQMKALVGVATVFLWLKPVTTILELVTYCKSKGVTGVISTNIPLLGKLLAAAGNPKTKLPSLDNYAGSYFVSGGIEFVFIHPLEQLNTVAYMKMLTKRFISKLATPESWASLPVPKFNWYMLGAANAEEIFTLYSRAYAISCDIETFKHNLAIRCIGYTAIFISDTGAFTTHSCVLPVDSDYNLALMRKFNWELTAPKIFQNGKYDISYLSRYNAVPFNYLWDTANMFHCWYSELPKDLAFLSAFFIRKAMYWKDLADTDDLEEYYRYNALDTQATALVFIAWIMQSPAWAKRNYAQEFPLVFPCHLSEMTGMARDMARLETAAAETEALIAKDNESLSRMVGVWPEVYNVNSAPQNTQLRAILGCAHIKSSDEKSLVRIGELHPLNKVIVDKILELRGNRKLASTYLTTGDKAKELRGRILYAINPHGTDTARMASREHHFWCGLQIQNIPQGKEVKQTIQSDPGFRFAEADLKQAESRGTAYVSGDKNLIAAVSSAKDFHAINASSFFGVAYESIFDDATGKTLDKALRDLAKRTNHGANYLMGANVLIETMGDKKVWEAKRMLGLPRHFGLVDVAKYLLAVFHRTYPSLEAVFYPGVVHEVMTTRMLESHTTMKVPVIYGDEPIWNAEWELEPLVGWTRYCFGDPRKNKRDKNALVAHVPQNLNAMALNKAFLRVFYEIAMHPKYRDHFKLCAQIHDSILFQFRVGHEYLMQMVAERMEVEIRIRGYDGVVRNFIVPADVKAGKDGMGAEYWSETE